MGAYVFCTDRPIPFSMHHAVSLKEVNYLFPLYLYPPPEGREKSKRGLFEDIDPFQGKERIENLSPKFRAFVDKPNMRTTTAPKKSWAISMRFSIARPIERNTLTS